MTTLTPREALRAIADGKNLEYRWCGTGEWRYFNNGVTVEDILRSSCFFRLAQEMITIGGVSFPKPVSEPLKEGQMYFIPDLTTLKSYYSTPWCNTDLDNLRLKRGLVHLTEENAIAHTKALVRLSGGNVDE